MKEISIKNRDSLKQLESNFLTEKFLLSMILNVIEKHLDNEYYEVIFRWLNICHNNLEDCIRDFSCLSSAIENNSDYEVI